MLVGLLVVIMATTVFYGVLKLKRMQETYDANCPLKEPSPPKEAKPAEGAKVA